MQCKKQAILKEEPWIATVFVPATLMEELKLVNVENDQQVLNVTNEIKENEMSVQVIFENKEEIGYDLLLSKVVSQIKLLYSSVKLEKMFFDDMILYGCKNAYGSLLTDKIVNGGLKSLPKELFLINNTENIIACFDSNTIYNSNNNNKEENNNDNSNKNGNNHCYFKFFSQPTNKGNDDIETKIIDETESLPHILIDYHISKNNVKTYKWYPTFTDNNDSEKKGNDSENENDDDSASSVEIDWDMEFNLFLSHIRSAFGLKDSEWLRIEINAQDSSDNEMDGIAIDTIEDGADLEFVWKQLELNINDKDSVVKATLLIEDEIIEMSESDGIGSDIDGDKGNANNPQALVSIFVYVCLLCFLLFRKSGKTWICFSCICFVTCRG